MSEKKTEESLSHRIEILADDTGARIRLQAFDTAVSLAAYGEAGRMREALERAGGDCRTYERLFSRTLPESDVWRLNHAGGEAVEVDARTGMLLQAALRYCAASDGAFDITVAPLVELWDFKRGIVPDDAALAEAAHHVDFHALDVWAQCGGNWFARLRDPAAQVDLGGIAKGWIADALGQSLMRAGATGAVVNLGGNVLVRGAKPDGGPWRVGIRDPREPVAPDGAEHYIYVVEMDEGSLVTSGTGERGFARDGRYYHHVLNPRTGRPVETPWASVSVQAARSIDAEGFSTTLLACGLDEARTLAARHPEIIQAYFADAEGAVIPLRA